MRPAGRFVIKRQNLSLYGFNALAPELGLSKQLHIPKRILDQRDLSASVTCPL
jgi:hypothetical protein